LRKNLELLPLLPLVVEVVVGLLLVVELLMMVPLLGTIDPAVGRPGWAVPERTSPLGRLVAGISPPGIRPAAKAAASAAAPGGSGS
jgi:hypothetical protein